MVKCELCGKEFKNKAGLGGHKHALHGTAKKVKPMLSLRMSNLEGYLSKMDASLSELFLNIDGRLKALEGHTELHSSIPSQKYSICTAGIKDTSKWCLGAKSRCTAGIKDTSERCSGAKSVCRLK